LFAFLKAQLASGKPEHYPALVTDVRNFGFFVDVTGLAIRRHTRYNAVTGVRSSDLPAPRP
jgi:hypothetical protein